MINGKCIGRGELDEEFVAKVTLKARRLSGIKNLREDKTTSNSL